MDTSAYLRRQGWRGDGHSLDHTNRGIAKPLLVSKKVDVLGVGLNKHTAVSDQWWLRAFDEGLKSLGTGQQSTLSHVQRHGINRGGLYGRFVKGQPIVGSIPTPPKDSQPLAKMGVDVPPEDKLERVVGAHPDQHAHDAMMHLLQNPDEAPSSMKKMLDKKRKRAERPVEKRARRKTERSTRDRSERQQQREAAIEDGTWDEEKEEERQRMKEINRQAKEFVLEAQRRGIIPAGPNEIRKGLIPTGANATALEDSSEGLKQVFGQAGLNSQILFKGSGKNSLKAQKYAREKMKRELKRAAKAYLMGEKPPHEQTLEEKKAKKAVKKQHTAQKKAVAAQKEAERMAGREERAAKKRELRAKKTVEKNEITRIIAERDAALKAGKTMEEYYADREQRELAAANGDSVDEGVAHAGPANGNENEFSSGVDEVKFGMNMKGSLKKIPGVGVVERYPSKAEKRLKKLKATAIKEGISEAEVQARVDAEASNKQATEQAKIDSYRAMKHGMNVDEYRAGVARGDVYAPKIEKKNLPLEKLAEYQQRAAEKGISLEEYIKRREEKYAAKQAEKLGNPYQKDLHLHEAATNGVEYITAEPDSHQIPIGGSNELGFVVDTAGDEKLANSNSLKAGGNFLAVVDTMGNDTFTWQPNMPVPIDPRVWEGKKVKDLPKPVRKARQEWMKARREEKKSRESQQSGAKPKDPKKPKGQRKVEAREAFVKQILFESRKKLRTGQGSGMMTIDGIENVPLVELETKEGIFKKGEVSLARTVARRVLRNVRRAQKAERGKGKGWKKRERSEKEAARNAGISGFTDRARLEHGASGSRDLLL